MGTVLGQFRRAFTVCSPNKLYTEILIIKNIFRKLSYPDSFINKAYYKARKSYFRINNQEEITRDLRYSLKIHHRLNPETKKLLHNDIRIINCIPHTVGRNFTNVLHKEGEREKNRGIYSIDCADCNKKYIGETDDLKRRIYQHKYSLEIGDLSSSLHKHRIDHNHFIDPNTNRLLFASGNVNHRRLVESFLIKNIPNFNSDMGSFNIDNFLNNCLITDQVFSKFLKNGS